MRISIRLHQPLVFNACQIMLAYVAPPLQSSISPFSDEMLPIREANRIRSVWPSIWFALLHFLHSAQVNAV